MASGSQGEILLPQILPVFAIGGAVVMPKGRIPLIVFEPRYISMIDDALGNGRMFALIQPDPPTEGVVPGLHSVGTLVRVVAFGETGDGRYLITGHGISRFKVIGERTGRKGYRRVEVNYMGFEQDLTEPQVTLPERAKLIELVRAHLGSLDLSGDWDSLATLSDDQLTDRLAMACPFSPEERQALLEAPDHQTRCSLMIALLQRELISESGNATIHWNVGARGSKLPLKNPPVFLTEHIYVHIRQRPYPRNQPQAFGPAGLPRDQRTAAI